MLSMDKQFVEHRAMVLSKSSYSYLKRSTTASLATFFKIIENIFLKLSLFAGVNVTRQASSYFIIDTFAQVAYTQHMPVYLYRITLHI